MPVCAIRRRNARPRFSQPRHFFPLLDARTGRVLTRAGTIDSPIPLGSLVKPFTALAYGDQHDFRYPAPYCRGTPPDAGCLTATAKSDSLSAIACSCNSYFRMLTTNLTAADVDPTAHRFGIEAPDHDAAGVPRLLDWQRLANLCASHGASLS